MSIYYDVIIGLLLAFIVWREYANTKERRDLLNRVMAKDLGDLKNVEGGRSLGSRNSVRAGLKRSMGESAHEDT